MIRSIYTINQADSVLARTSFCGSCESFLLSGRVRGLEHKILGSELAIGLIPVAATHKMQDIKCPTIVLTCGVLR